MRHFKKVVGLRDNHTINEGKDVEKERGDYCHIMPSLNSKRVLTVPLSADEMEMLGHIAKKDRRSKAGAVRAMIDANYRLLKLEGSLVKQGEIRRA